MKLNHFTNIYALDQIIKSGVLMVGRIHIDDTHNYNVTCFTTSDSPSNLGLPDGSKFPKGDFILYPIGMSYIKKNGEPYRVNSKQVKIEIDSSNILGIISAIKYHESEPRILKHLAALGIHPDLNNYSDKKFKSALKDDRNKVIASQWYYAKSNIDVSLFSDIFVKINDKYVNFKEQSVQQYIANELSSCPLLTK